MLSPMPQHSFDNLMAPMTTSILKQRAFCAKCCDREGITMVTKIKSGYTNCLVCLKKQSVTAASHQVGEEQQAGVRMAGLGQIEWVGSGGIAIFTE